MEIDQIGYAVEDMDAAVSAFKYLFEDIGKIVFDHTRNLKICFCENGNTRVELLSPLDKTKYSPIDKILKKNHNIPYHICYKTKCIELEIEKLVNEYNYILVLKPEKAIACNNKKVAFLYSQYIGLIELIEY